MTEKRNRETSIGAETVEPPLICGLEFRGSDDLRHLCDLQRDYVTGRHNPPGIHYCLVHQVEESC